MSALDPRGTQSPPPQSRSFLPYIAVAIVGLLAGLIVQELRQHNAGATTASKMQLAESDFRHGKERAAFALFSKFADQKNPVAEYWIAHMTELGLDTPRNPQKAIELYKKAADQNVVAAERRNSASCLLAEERKADPDELDALKTEC
jgi:TPR repeat protein